MADFVGKHTYGAERINVERWDSNFNPRNKVTIGNFCSIAINVTIITNGNHKYHRVSTYPFGELGWIENSNIVGNAYGKGDIVIGNDVWIDEGVTILSGVTIGDGAILGAHAVVSKDVPPYAIAVGNPAKVVKYRFDQDTIDQLLQIKWWDWEDHDIKEALPLILKDDNCKDFVEKYKKN